MFKGNILQLGACPTKFAALKLNTHLNLTEKQISVRLEGEEWG